MIFQSTLECTGKEQVSCTHFKACGCIPVCIYGQGLMHHDECDPIDWAGKTP